VRRNEKAASVQRKTFKDLQKAWSTIAQNYYDRLQSGSFEKSCGSRLLQRLLYCKNQLLQIRQSQLIHHLLIQFGRWQFQLLFSQLQTSTVIQSLQKFSFPAGKLGKLVISRVSPLFFIENVMPLRVIFFILLNSFHPLGILKYMVPQQCCNIVRLS